MTAVAKMKRGLRREARGVYVPLQNADIIRRCSNVFGTYDPHKQRNVIYEMLQERGIIAEDFQREDGSFLLRAMRNRNISLVILPS